MVTLVIAGENKYILSSLKAALEATGSVYVVGEYADADEMAPELSRLKPDVVIVGGSENIFNRCQTCEEIRRLCPTTKILTLFESRQDDDLCEIILSGASGCVFRGDSSSEIARSVGIVANGGFSFDRDALTRLMRRIPKRVFGEAPVDLDELSERQVSVISLIARGYKNREIGQRLNVSNSTVKSDIANIKDKLMIDSRAELAAYTIRSGIID